MGETTKLWNDATDARGSSDDNWQRNATYRQLVVVVVVVVAVAAAATTIMEAWCGVNGWHNGIWVLKILALLKGK